MNNTVHVLDCTLRDGGYVNDWRFGDENAVGIVGLTALSGVEYSEIAFIRECTYEKNKIEFSHVNQITDLFHSKPCKLAAMVEIGYGYPVEMFPVHSAKTVDMIRLVVWKRMIDESFDYARQLLDKGYEVCIQATRIEQYENIEFQKFVHKFSELPLRAFYIVDTFGLLTKERLLEYALIADRNLRDGTYIGYHAHNNMQQAFSNMAVLCEQPWQHELMIDASVMGIGRGAGNLCLELLENYQNERASSNFKLAPLYECADRYIQPIFLKTPWGYSMPYLLSAKNGVNPSYATYMKQKGVSIQHMMMVFEQMRLRNEGIRYDPHFCDRLIAEICN